MDFQWGLGDADWIRSTAAQLLRLAPDLILANGDAATRIAQQSTRMVPIIFIAGSDPVAEGLVQSLAPFASSGHKLRNASAVMCKTGPRTANRKTASRRPLQIKLFWSGGCEGNGTRPLPAPPADQTAASHHEAGQSRPCDRTRHSHRHIHRDVVDVKPTAA
jgi:hypothetical protein